MRADWVGSVSIERIYSSIYDHILLIYIGVYCVCSDFFGGVYIDRIHSSIYEHILLIYI